jgi:hypothetical protein
LKKKFNFSDPNNRKKGCSHIGLQGDGKVWVLSSSLHLNEDGCLLSKEESKYVWLPQVALIGTSSDVSSASLSPIIRQPLSTEDLYGLLVCMKKCFKHNFIPSIMTLAGGLLALNYEAILESYEGCPVPYVYGPSQTGKTQACKTALALLGMLQKGFYKKTTSQKWFLERCSLSSMPFAIDDPRDVRDRRGNNTVPSDLLDLINDIFDGGIVANLRLGAIRPRSTCIITANALPPNDK